MYRFLFVFGLLTFTLATWIPIQHTNVQNFSPNVWSTNGTTCLCNMMKNNTFCSGNGFTWNMTLWDINPPPNSQTFGLFPFANAPTNNDPFNGTIGAIIPVPIKKTMIPARIIFKLRIAQVFDTDLRPFYLELLFNNHSMKTWNQNDIKLFSQYRDINPVLLSIPHLSDKISINLKYLVSSNPIFSSSIELMVADFRLDVWIPPN